MGVGVCVCVCVWQWWWFVWTVCVWQGDYYCVLYDITWTANGWLTVGLPTADVNTTKTQLCVLGNTKALRTATHYTLRHQIGTLYTVSVVRLAQYIIMLFNAVTHCTIAILRQEYNWYIMLVFNYLIISTLVLNIFLTIINIQISYVYIFYKYADESHRELQTADRRRIYFW